MARVDLKDFPLTNFPIAKAYRWLEPGPVILIATRGERGPNVMTCGFHMMMQHDPPLIGCIVGPWDHSMRALRETGECVIGVPGVDIAETVIDIGNCSGSDVDKFVEFGLTERKAKKVRAPLIAECLVNLECRVEDDDFVERYNLWVLRVVAASVNTSRTERRTFHHRGDGTFTVDGEVMNLQERMVRWKMFQD